MYEWLRREHVRPVDLYLILLDGRPVGFIQTYLVADYPDFGALVGLGEGVAGVDLFVGEEELTGKGLGTAVVRAFVRDVVFARSATTACVADPDVRNTASLRAFERAGFRRVGEFVDPEDGQPHAVLRLDREA
jgi:aminoglycoside 6'-N-acetyltransferase